MRFACAIALLALVTAPAAAAAPAANRLAATVGALDGSAREFELQSSLGAARFGWSLQGDVLASRRQFGEPLEESAFGIALAAPLTRALSVEGSVIEHFQSGGADTRQGFAGARLIDAGARGRFWAGYANATSARGAQTGGPVFQTGGEMAIGRLSLSGSLARSTTTWHVTIPGATVHAGDSTITLGPDEEETRRSTGSTVRLGSTWSATRWSAATMGGVRWESAFPAARWLRVEGAWWLRPRLALRLGVGREIADPWQVGSARRGASLALEFTQPRWETPASPTKSPHAVTLRVVNVTGDLRRIEVTAPGAGRIEAMGDFTMWDPLELRRASGGRFVLELPLAPGVYRVQVRRDGGAWMNPVNLPGMDDPDLGEAGTLVIE